MFIIIQDFKHVAFGWNLDLHWFSPSHFYITSKLRSIICMIIIYNIILIVWSLRMRFKKVNSTKSTWSAMTHCVNVSSHKPHSFLKSKNWLIKFLQWHERKVIQFWNGVMINRINLNYFKVDKTLDKNAMSCS